MVKKSSSKKTISSTNFNKYFRKLLIKHKIEVFFLSLAIIATILSIILYIKTSQELNNQLITFENNEVKKTRVVSLIPKRTIFIDMSGAVEKPDLYQVTSGARLKDIMVLANGLSLNADRDFFARNYNLARTVRDQEKIYIPTKQEVRSGIFKEPTRLIDYGYGPSTTDISPSSQNQSEITVSKININSASLEELDLLPGVGPVTAQKIVDNRPYSSVNELLLKKIIKKNVYENIKDKINVN